MSKILIYPDPKLLQSCDEVKVFNKDLNKKLSKLARALQTAGAIGIAAPQLGFNDRIFLATLTPGHGNALVFINPEITPLSTRMLEIEEECLSVPGQKVKMKRFNDILVSYQTKKGVRKQLTARGLLAVICQHENDHLRGITIANPVQHDNQAQK